MRIYVYDRIRNRIEKFDRAGSDPVPYSRNKFLSLREFKGSSKYNTLWITKEAVENFNTLRLKWGKPIHVGYAFKSISEGGHGPQSQHYAGTAFDIAQKTSVSTRKQLHQLAVKLKIWSYVEPISMTPTWIHVDKRWGPPACSAGFPVTRLGSKGNYVFTLQDALRNKFKYNIAIDGVFGRGTQNAVINYQGRNRISQTGVVACQTWKSLVK